MHNTFELLETMLRNDRSIRRYDESFYIDAKVLRKIVGLTTLCASGRNLQPMKYYLVSDRDLCRKIFPLLKWAGYLPEWEGPEPGERPSAYIIQCLDSGITGNYLCDDGLQLQTITLGAVALGLGCCIIKSFNIPKLREVLNIGQGLEPLYVVAVGKPVEEVVIEPLDATRADAIKYYRTPDKVHHVPKRNIDELIIETL